MFGTVSGGPFSGHRMFHPDGTGMFGKKKLPIDQSQEGPPVRITVHSIEDARAIHEKIPNSIIHVVGDRDNNGDKKGNDNENNQNNNSPIVDSPPSTEAVDPGTSTNTNGLTDSTGAGLNDACLKSGFSQRQCNSYLFSKDPGGACSTAALGGATNCPVQDPSKTSRIKQEDPTDRKRNSRV